ncbi:MAG TPA: CHAT domain-containing protein [Acidimicrobiales bacterium]|nr:CHAT domain-containing protein [Acidimicrobiales bacterium]
MADEQPREVAALGAELAATGAAAGDHRAEAVARRAVGMAARALDDIDRAVAELEASAAAARLADDPVLLAEAQISLASSLAFRGEGARALETIEAVDAGSPLAAAAAADRAAILGMLGRYDESLAAFRTAIPALRRAGDRLREARSLGNRGLLHLYRGELAAGDADLARAGRLHEAMGRPAEVAQVELNRGWGAVRRGELPTALAHLAKAERGYAAAGVPEWRATLDRAEALLAAGLAGDAADAAARAIDGLRSSANQATLAEGLVVLADAAYLGGDAARAAQAAGEAAELFAAQDRPMWAAVATVSLARAGLAAGQLADPEEVDRAAAVVAASAGPANAADACFVAGRLWLAAAGDREEGAAARSVGDRLGDDRGGADRAGADRTAADHGRAVAADRADHDRAVSAAEAALRRAAAHRRRGPASARLTGWQAEAVRREAAGNRTGALRALRASLDLWTDHQASLGAAELRAHVTVHAREAAQAGLRLAIAGGRARSILAWMERHRASSLAGPAARPPADPELAGWLTQLRAVASELAEQNDTGGDPRPLLARQAELERLVRERTWVRPADPAQSYRGNKGSDEGAALDEALGDWALVELADSDGVLHAVVVAGGRCWWRPLGSAAAASAELEHLRFALRRAAYDTGGRTAGAVTRAAERLDAQLLGSLRRLIGDRPVAVVPTGPLHATPWGVLPTLASRPVTVSPSARLWARARAGTGGDAGRDGVLLVAGPDLPGVAAETRALRALYPDAAALTGRRATASAVTRAMGGTAVAHVAAHATFRADNGLWSAVLLADGPLTVYDLEGLDRPPELVVLSACQSGLSTVRPGDELLGLAAGLLGLGTRTVVASVVPVADLGTTELMVAFHRGLSTGSEPAAALAAAAGGPGPFVCFGAG